MAHQRYRFCESVVLKALKHAPCIGVLGMRQVGKSTLLKQLAARYYSFDHAEFTAQFERQGASLLEAPGYPLAIDEIQKYPPAFDAIKYSVDNQRRPGRFLLSGSVRFSSRRHIRESLTGRVVLVELFPFNLAECHHKKLSIFLESVAVKPLSSLVARLKKTAWANTNQLTHYLVSGGLPGICFLRDAHLRADYFSNHIDTLLGRDLQLVHQIRLPISKLTLMLTELAKNQGHPCNRADLARKAGCSQPTVKVILEAFEGLFLIRSFGKTYFVEDAGLSNFLCPLTPQLSRQDMIRSVFYELRAQITYGSQNHAKLEPYQTRAGSEIPFLITLASGKQIALAIEADEIPSDKSLKGLTWLKKKTPNLKALILCTAQKPFTTATGVLCLPWTWVF